MNYDIITIIPSALAVVAPLVIGTMLIGNHNNLASMRRGIDTTLSELSSLIIQRNNDFARLIEPFQDKVKEVDKYFLGTIKARKNAKRAVELRDPELISKTELQMSSAINDMIDELKLAGITAEETSKFLVALEEHQRFILELRNQYNFKVDFYNQTMTSLPYILTSKILRLKKYVSMTF